MSNTADVFNRLEDIIKKAKKRGATNVDVAMVKSTGIGASVRMGEPEELEQKSASSFSLAVFIGDKTASTSIESLRDNHVDEAIDGVLDAARLSSENPFGHIAEQHLLTSAKPDLDLYDPTIPTTQELFDLAGEIEDAALQNKGLKQSEGASVGRSERHVYMMMTNGFSGHLRKSQNYLSCSVIAESPKGMETDYAHDVAIYGSDLRDTSAIGQEAAQRVMQRLDARKVKSGKFPVIFDKRIAGRLVGEFASAVSGSAVFKEATFLKDAFGKQVLPKGMNIIDDPLLKRGLGSRPFTNDGLEARRTLLVEDGVLTSWILDLESARKMKLDIRDHAVGTSNLYIENGNITPADLMADIKDGFYVTGLMGHGGDTLTGNFSFGASGLWIKDGKPDFAVSEVTIAGDMGDMFKNMTPANDLDMRRPSAPTMRIEGMTIAGS